MCRCWGQPDWLVLGPESPQFSAAGEQGGGPGHPCASPEQVLGGPQHRCGSSRRKETPAHAAHGRAPERLPTPQLRTATPEQAPGERQEREPGVRQGEQGTPPTTLDHGSCSDGLAVLQHLTPHSRPPTLCLLQTIVLYLHKLSPRSVRRCRGSGEVGLSGSMEVRGSEGAAPCEAAPGAAGAGDRSEGSGVSSLFCQRLAGRHGAGGGTGHGRVQPSLCSSSSTVGPRSVSAQPPSCPARGCSGSAGAGPARAGGGGSAERWCSVRGSLYIFIYKQGQQCCGVAMRNSCSGAGCSRKIWCCSSNGEIRGTAKARRRFCAPVLPSGLPSSPPGARCKGVVGLSVCRQTSLAPSFRSRW